MASHTRMTPQQCAELRAVLLEGYLADRSEEFLSSPDGQAEVEDHLEQRYRLFGGNVLPWIRRHVDLADKVVVEIGCGTGSSTAAIAPLARTVHAYEVSADAGRVCAERMRILGIQNVQMEVLAPLEIQRHLDATFGTSGIDVVMLYAVLEHMSLDERLLALANTWRLLNPGGFLIVGETPNRLVYSDEHTSGLPFFNMLPDDLALLYARKSSRAHFVDDLKQGRRTSRLYALEKWGRGVSYHDFEVAIGDLAGLVVGGDDGPDQKSGPEEELLQRWFELSGLDLPVCFTRAYLELILRKPAAADPVGSGPSFAELYALYCPPSQQDAALRMLDEHWASVDQPAIEARGFALQRALHGEEPYFRVFAASVSLRAGRNVDARGELVAALMNNDGLSRATREWAFDLIEECWKQVDDIETEEQSLEMLEAKYGGEAFFSVRRAEARLRAGRPNDAQDELVGCLTGERELLATTRDWAIGLLEECWTEISDLAVEEQSLETLEAKYGGATFFSVRRAEARLRAHQADQAQKEVVAALTSERELSPTMTEWAFGLLEECWRKIEDPVREEGVLDQLQPRFGNRPYFPIHRASALQRAGRPADAQSLLVATLTGDRKLQPLTRDWSFGMLEACWGRMNDPAVAEAALSAMEDRFGLDAAYLFLKAVVLRHTGHADDSLRLLQRTLELHPDHARARAQLAEWSEP